MTKEFYQLNKTLISKGNCISAGSILYVHHRDEDGNIFLYSNETNSMALRLDKNRMDWVTPILK